MDLDSTRTKLCDFFAILPASSFEVFTKELHIQKSSLGKSVNQDSENPTSIFPPTLSFPVTIPAAKSFNVMYVHHLTWRLPRAPSFLLLHLTILLKPNSLIRPPHSSSPIPSQANTSIHLCLFSNSPSFTFRL